MTNSTPLELAANELRDDFEFLSDWEERYAHIIDLGKSLAPLSDAEMNDSNKVLGCASQVWLVTEPSTKAGCLKFRGASDAILVSGLIALLLQIYSDNTPQDILAFDANAFFASIGVDEALSPQRSNGFKSMLARIREDAQAALNA
ncbi:SufE family protein [Hirschia baltica]|uniref:Fe-S metabolism associated SufE n=1 Tax=Hirschia baltica (strain ATCC 49814 / DSM 5838 / IFAM 1418) TaxID=582402 RepID=C6XI98_HIRBI|nr:SufE family protein [Hirschia baltica]ACT58924.1 Fe-S metabolism associated SufE [Hirschia baltica ATCC 49814]